MTLVMGLVTDVYVIICTVEIDVKISEVITPLWNDIFIVNSFMSLIIDHRRVLKNFRKENGRREKKRQNYNLLFQQMKDGKRLILMINLS